MALTRKCVHVVCRNHASRRPPTAIQGREAQKFSTGCFVHVCWATDTHKTRGLSQSVGCLIIK